MIITHPDQKLHDRTKPRDLKYDVQRVQVERGAK